jgi:hypothetical protein
MALGCGSSAHSPDGPIALVDGSLDGRPGSSFETAIDITSRIDNGEYLATLASTITKDYYKVTLSTGDRIDIGTITDFPTKPRGTVTDTVITLWDSRELVFAQDDDGWPSDTTDSQLYVEVPAGGTYYVTVEDCNSAFGSNLCAPAANVTNLNYTLFVAHTSTARFPESNAAATQDGTTSHAQSILYAVPQGGTSGDYGYYILDGNFRSTNDTHVFGFIPPAAMLATGTRERVEFWVQPVGASNGDGSTSNVKAWVTPADGTTILSQAVETNFGNGDTGPNGPLDLSLPVTMGTQYYLFVQSAATSSRPTTDYYFIQHFAGSWFIDAAEMEDASGTGMNDTMQTAEVLTARSGFPGDYFVDGNIGILTDVDWYEVDPATGDTMFELDCRATREGSGIVGITATLYDASGTTVLGAIGPETATADLYKTFPLPVGTTKAFMKVSASSLDALDTGTFYRCGTYYY